MDTALLGKLIRGENLSFAEMQSAMEGIVEGRWTPAQIAGFLIALRIKGETPEEIAAAAQALRSNAIKVPVTRSNVIDTCGTGGDHSGTFNISTAAAIVAASSGAAVAKHGNRAISSRCGSANVLQELGINIELTPEQVGACIDKVGIGFLFAPKLNPGMKHVAGPRQELGQRTMFNLMGPLLNPAQAKRQVIGVFGSSALSAQGDKLTRVIADVLQRLGSEHVMVVSGTDGIDEISLCAPTLVAELKDGAIKEYILNPQDLGFSLATKEDLLGGDAPQNAAILRDVFSGAKGPKRDVVSLNAAAALYVSGMATNLKDGVAKVKAALDAGAAKTTLEKWAAFSQNPA